MHELLTDPAHKAVVFSQWEVMIQKTAEVLDTIGVGYTLLHGRIPGKDRRKLIDQFRDDQRCRVFLSTDAGGTGLNLQSADTVINMEVPWNPAVLEQRVARVHRMGQDRPVRVVHLVTRNSIEERVQRVIEQKRALFAGLFDGETDEVSFAALGQPAFLEAVRELLDDGRAGSVSDRSPEEARAALLVAGVHFLEALAVVMTTEKPAGPPDLVARGAAALRAILGSLDGTGEPVE
jgi:superfamily II DNA/RNA helicase